ncbi:MAG: cupin domain-containing protein [Deltaproteobacteria bacterium]|nr:cupin domain-containing protein [Deltaproteobacteria bacterium]
MSPEVQKIISALDLAPHPEGGFYRETYRSEQAVELGSGSDAFPNRRSFNSAIYYLLYDGAFSALHRIKSDEIWHFYRGSAVEICAIEPRGGLSRYRLGAGIEKGDTYQVVIKAGCWFGARLSRTNSYALVGCTVSPGFDFRDFELAEREALLQAYPQHRAIIERLCR